MPDEMKINGKDVKDKKGAKPETVGKIQTVLLTIGVIITVLGIIGLCLIHC